MDPPCWDNANRIFSLSPSLVVRVKRSFRKVELLRHVRLTEPEHDLLSQLRIHVLPSGKPAQGGNALSVILL